MRTSSRALATIVATALLSWTCSDSNEPALELLLNGAFSPLEGFLSREAYDSVLATMRLPSGLLWPIPITLDVTREFAAGLEEGNRIAGIGTVDLRVSREDAGDEMIGSIKAQRLQRELEKLKPGDEVELRVYSDGRTRSVKL